MYEVTRLADDATCMDALDVDKLRRQPGKVIRSIVSTDGERFVRTLVPVKLGQRERLADISTGTLYDPATGKCLSSDKLRLEHV